MQIAAEHFRNNWYDIKWLNSLCASQLVQNAGTWSPLTFEYTNEFTRASYLNEKTY